MLHPKNHAFWGTVEIRCGNDAVALVPESKAMDLVLIYAIEAGGFNLVAKSYEDAKSMPRPPKFYLDRVVSTVNHKVQPIKLVNSAIAKLDELDLDKKDKLFMIMKCIDSNSIQYKKNTPADIVYMNADNFIRGKGADPKTERAAQTFLDAAKQSTEDLTYKAMVRDGIWYQYIVLKSDGLYWHIRSNSMMGKTIQECAEFLKSPANDTLLREVQTKLEQDWKK